MGVYVYKGVGRREGKCCKNCGGVLGIGDVILEFCGI